MENKILVSIVVPVYNTSKYLDECLSSLVNQTLKDIEIICVNDASTDNSLEILNSWAQKDNRITVIDSKVNMRQGAARNIAIKAAKGKYIGLVDSDDYIAKEMYETLIANSNDCTVDIVVSNLWAAHSEIDTFHTNFRQEISDIDSIRKSVLVSGCHMVTNIIKKGLFEEYNLWYPENIRYEDNANRSPLFLAANSIVVCHNTNPFYFYRTNNISTMRCVDGVHQWDRLITANIFLEHTKRMGQYEKFKEEIDYSYYMLFVLASFQFAMFSFSRYQYKKVKEIIAEYEQTFGMKEILQNKYYIQNRQSFQNRLTEMIYHVPIYGYVIWGYSYLKHIIKDVLKIK